MQPMRRLPIFHSGQRRTLALRGAQGDHRAQRGSSRSKRRAALVEWRKWESPSGVVRGECRGGLGGAAAPNRPPSAARRAGGPNNRKEKPPRARRAQQPLLKGQACSLFSPEHQPHEFCITAPPAAQAAQAAPKEKSPCPQGVATTSQRKSLASILR